MTVSFKVTKEDIAEIHRVLDKYYQLVVSEEYIKELLKKNPDYAWSIRNCGASDTREREVLIDRISEDLLGSRYYWPCNMDSQHYSQEYYSKLKAECDRRGFEFNIETE